MWWEKMTMNENFFVGHFPEAPVMPGVLIKQAQTGGILKYSSRS
jgi:UDP-3-O-[3-hydroxymyristoyl] N-acetylglucosamine deacetylase/3-hydroxyacyl-[acyl-carrier-protein] dehydratase